MNWQDLGPSVQLLFENHPYFGIFMAGFIAFIESLAIIGSIVPGSVMMSLVGLLLGSSILPLKSTLFSIFWGAFIGDYVSYIFGKKYKNQIISHSLIQPYHHWIQHAEAFMRKHGALSIVIGRFVGPMRSIIPMIAGIANMNLALFTIAIIPTIILWSIVYLSPGFIWGALAVSMGENYFLSIITKTLLAVLVLALWHSQHTLIRIVTPKLKKRYSWCTMSAKNITHISKFIILVVASIFLAYLHILKTPMTIFWDNAAHYYFLHSLSDHVIVFANAVSKVSDHIAFLLINVAILVVLYYHRHFRLLAIWLLFSSCIFIVAVILKYGLLMPRPNPALDPTGFPSGHVFLTGSLWLCLSSLLEPKRPSTALAMRRLTFLYIVFIIAARLILQAHWFTDLLTSFLMALAVWHLFAYVTHQKLDIPAKHLKQVGASVSLVVVTMLLIHSHLPAEFAPRYADPITVNKTRDAYRLPSVRYSPIGKIVAPFNFIWIGNEESLKNYFQNENWKQYPSNRSILGRIYTLLTMNKYHAVLPVFPPKLDGKNPDLIFGKESEDKSTIAKFWKLEGKIPTYIGTVSMEVYPESFFLKEYFICQESRYDINQIFSGHSTGKIISSDPIDMTSKSISPFCWNGETLLEQAKYH